MTELLFLVARRSHGSRQPPQPRVLRRRRPRPDRPSPRRAPAGSAKREARLDRRGRRSPSAPRTTDHELRSIGYSIVTLEGARGRRVEGAPPGQSRPRCARSRGYLREQFRFFTPIPSWDVRREGQAFVLLNGEGRPAHRLLFAKEFLDYYGHAGPRPHRPAARRVEAHPARRDGRAPSRPRLLLRDPRRRLVAAAAAGASPRRSSARRCCAGRRPRTRSCR